MARRVALAERTELSNPESNPAVFGEQVDDLFWQAVGLAGTAYVSDKIAGPLVGSVAPGLAANEMTGKAVDAVATGATAWVAGRVVGMASPSVGRLVRRGGVFLAVAKAISILVPGFAISASVPSAITVRNPFAAPLPPVPPARMLPNGNGHSVQMLTASRRLGI